ncbi:sodium:proton antiporter [candidate division KSB1 bacterium]|nr:sodium:proton antiporter [candidate division KSB1 bacterium]NIR68395.1 sodium:proton antiporter [candidate division KSB1 bacterium]NIS22469.1 sodium:proton antiporter [candidate division KSB1 bacterium]NIT69317.1 sodium:proton antiporter [candidate division KSB1 bacterium]NIU22974.1 sodium:proton antiporter [candidate division KSB1 bacterium]
MIGSLEAFGYELSNIEGGQEVSEQGGLGAELPLWSVIPFIGILLSIAIFPLTAEKFWHHHFGKVSAFWALLFAVPFYIAYQGEAIHSILHTYLLEYIPFIILLWALYTVAGGILVEGAPVGMPFNNLVLLIIGTALASWIGTTGAAMVLIRPLIRMNRYRKSKVHLVVFFIFLVANIGGSLTPLGDPPLFLGFLQGVEFFWTFNLFTEMILVVAILLVGFFLLDTYMFRQEGWHKKMHLKHSHFELHEHSEDMIVEEEVEMENAETHKLTTQTYRMSVHGLYNVLFLLGVLGGVLFSGQVHLGEVTVLGVHMKWQNIVRDLFLICMGLISLKVTPRTLREGNEFTWFPIQEVGKLFAGIFITIIPAIAMLRAGQHGQLKFVIDAVKEPVHYFWITGVLSSFLDNAPTYLVFFNTALGKFSETVHWLMGDGAIYLKAISTGAVFFGAMTYIGNAPNFMVKSIAEEAGIDMPSFFGFMIYSILILVPIFLLVTFIFF